VIFGGPQAMSTNSNTLDNNPQAAGRPLVRENRPTDSVAIQRILGESGLSLLPTSEPRSSSTPQNSPDQVHVCESGGEIVAVLQSRLIDHELEILDVAVDSKQRRKGFATLLLESVLQVAKQRGAQEFFLEVRESNAAALALYRKFGFVVAGRRPSYYRRPDEAALLLRLRFTA
jgi:[ribosomal protein S18]-alanine N-acetyltransferase